VNATAAAETGPNSGLVALGWLNASAEVRGVLSYANASIRDS
jgi:hypothetical protein